MSSSPRDCNISETEIVIPDSSHGLAAERSRGWDLCFAALVTAVTAILVAWPFVDVSLGGDHYVHLARHFVRGDLTVDGLSNRYGDVIRAGGHAYLPFGPLPAVLLIPFLPILDAGIPLVVIGYVFTLLNVVLFNRILREDGVGAEKRKWVTLFLFAGTPYLGIAIAGISTYFAHIVATTFLLWSMIVLRSGRKPWLSGLLLGGAGAARLTLGFGAPYFLTQLRKQNGWVGAALKFSAGAAVPVILLALYNHLRFGSITETGFGLALLYSPELEAARREGLMSIAHVPKNLYMMLLKGPEAIGGDGAAILRFPYLEPSKWGMSLVFTSPALLYALRTRMADERVRSLWLGVVSIAVPLVLYYGIGYVQFGYRYALDFMPFLVLLAAMGMPEPMSNRARALIALSVLVCIWGAIHVAVWV